LIQQRAASGSLRVSEDGDEDDEKNDADAKAFLALLVNVWPAAADRLSPQAISKAVAEEDEEEEEDYGRRRKEISKLPPGSRRLENHSLYLFAPENRFRLWCHGFVTHTYFDMGVVVLIVLSTVLLALQNPHRPFEGTFAKVLDISDLVFTCLFMSESLLKASTALFFV
jgi:hypothetical protein